MVNAPDDLTGILQEAHHPNPHERWLLEPEALKAILAEITLERRRLLGA